MRAGCPGAALVAAAALLLLPGAEALGTQRKARRYRPRRHAVKRRETLHITSPVVHVQRDFFEGLVEPPEGMRLEKLGTLDQANFSMAALYGAPVCTGRGWFVEKGRAPSEFCRHKNGRVDESIEGRWHPEFDEYALEKIMMGKWLESPARCLDGASCEGNADLVVLPSPYMSAAMQLGWKWKNIWSLNSDSFKKYWELVQTRYFSTGRSPLVVVHMPYCWARPGLLQALMKQPKSFSSRVVIAGIESNLQGPDRALFGKQWSGSALAQLRARAKQRMGPPTAPSGEPVLFTLPYPTSVLKSVLFTEDDHEASYSANTNRRVNVSFIGNLSKSSSMNWIRTMVHNKIDSLGAEPSSMMVNSSILCPSYRSWRPNCGLGLAMSMWDVVADSTFCLEPPGDTPTRSHFYIAVQSGCVPVLFNGGHSAYEKDEPGWFAWRKAPTVPGESPVLPGSIEDLFQDANKMAVVFNSSDVADDKVDVMKELLEMPTANPRRLLHLRHTVDNAAPLMTFSSEAPGLWLPGCGPSDEGNKPQDAFEAFQGIMLWEAQQHTAPGSTPAWC